jgi:NAD(P)-dependent dehydrogenase (short-subunit alcohol dehydrogenase family)
MDLSGRTVIVTGAAGGIGRALAEACAAAGARVAAVDVRTDEILGVGRQLGLGHLAVPCDVTDLSAVESMVSHVRHEFGSIDVCFANAGVAVGTDPIATSDAVWDRAYAVNVRQHVWLARLLLPEWLSRGEGYFVATTSAAGLLTQVGSAPYSVTKHAAVAFAEWLAVTYGDAGVRVSCLAPMGVETAMLAPGAPDAIEAVARDVVRAAGKVLDPADVAAEVLAAMRTERFLILPHPEVEGYFQRKAADYERWLAGMRRIQATAAGAPRPSPPPP